MERAISLAIAMLVLTGMPGCGEEEQRAPGRNREAIRAACAAEIEKFCAGDDRIGQCLRRNDAELSEGCKAVLGERTGGNRGGG